MLIRRFHQTYQQNRLLAIHYCLCLSLWSSYSSIASNASRPFFPTTMCDYTQVQYKCTHVRYVVKAWCTKYQQTHVRCPANVTAVEYRLNENCGDCRR
ncbi:hypothetical protein BKA58DRAFT_371629 [Alternaria rosae]|uniref:uncharacterized protein n=1 Tax=Alternaria rosae TaxID=1187941 RepID=UPI001E8E9E54|nr:uncharacterized protein BKA58DRAFT_371629 [Alternaria rosae]KAH6881473.1 hypothetical protein BKA58DRAFT_371629 [Alternaria rosae]